MALADAGLIMKDMVTAVAVGCIDGTVVADLSYDEEAFEGEVADIPVAVLPNSGKITLLQMDGEISKENILKAIELAKKVCKHIYEVQKKALKEKYTVVGDEE
jgi:exosome complex component RRP41